MQEEESQLVVNPQVTMDPTLPRTEDVQCPNCNKSEAVFFTASTRDLDKAMSLVFVCCVVVITGEIRTTRRNSSTYENFFSLYVIIKPFR